MSDSKLPAPPVNLEAEEFYRASREGKFLLKRSVLTRKPHWYPRAYCPFDGSDTEWFEASGTGRIYSYSVVADPQPYVVAYITLQEGPTMLSNIVDCDFTKLSIGDPVRIVFKDAGEFMIPCFTTAVTA